MTEVYKPRIISRTEYKVPKEKQSVSFRIQRRRQRLLAIYLTAKRFSINKAAESLSVSRFTVARDIAFLRANELLSPRRNSTIPYVVVETGTEYMARFNAACSIKKS